ncbi:UNVERIFIED_ORG: hypothetical protein LHK14_08620 [Roseateles sp. XES5]|nr:hypothetical protein [Roseateles sp. XES5]
MPEDFINRYMEFLCGFSADGGKTIERLARACLAWDRAGRKRLEPGIVVAKKQSPGFLLMRRPAPQRTRLH